MATKLSAYRFGPKDKNILNAVAEKYGFNETDSARLCIRAFNIDEFSLEEARDIVENSNGGQENDDPSP